MVIAAAPVSRVLMTARDGLAHVAYATACAPVLAVGLALKAG